MKLFSIESINNRRGSTKQVKLGFGIDRVLKEKRKHFHSNSKS